MSAAVELDLFAPPPVAAPRVYRTAVRAHLRRVKHAPASGAALRDRALDGQASAQRVALDYVRRELAALYRSRVATWPAHRAAFVNADDADRILRAWAACPMEVHARGSQNWRGSIFRGKDWQLTGSSQPALRKHMHGTTIPGWRYVGSER